MSTGRILLFFLCIYTTVVLYLITIRVHHILTIHSERTEREQAPVPRVCVQNDTKQENVEIKIREIPAPVYQQPAQFGPGSYGEPVEFDGLLTENDTKQIEQFHRIYDYNAFISDLIPFPRLLPDYRPSECRKINYPDNLPKVSVIIPFRNERLSVLLRTIHNILFYTPEHLLEEIIIVDDASTEIELTFKLDLHVQSLSKVVLIRKATNVGLMMARQAGIDISKADYFICMDSHIEVSLGWVEPILNRLVEKPKALVYSNIGSIDNENFEVKMNRGQFGVPFDFPFFAWNFEQEQSRHSEAYKLSRTNKTDPILMGSAMGMMICMKKSWFYQLGGFDPGMKIWGSEQIEISVKVWMCGGVVEMIPCSFVAHIYRRIVWNLRHVGHTNKVRLIETWVDEPYKQIIYNYNGFKPESVDYGDISERLKVREQNQCKSFQYFLDKIREFANIHIPSESRKLGTWRNVQTNMCLDRNGRQEFPIQYPCHDPAASQYFEYTIEDTIRHLGHCLYVNNEDNILFKHCDHFGDASPKKWRYNETEQTFVHISTGKCMTADLNSNKIVGRDCTSSNEQKWRWESK